MNTSEKVGLAVEMRLRNSSWAEVADTLGYSSADSARATLRGGDRAEWNRLLAERHDQVIADCEAVALAKQRDLLNCGDLNIEQRAAHSLLNHAARHSVHRIAVTHNDGLKLDSPGTPVIIADLKAFTAAYQVDKALPSPAESVQ